MFVIVGLTRKSFEPRSNIPWLKMIIWVNGVLRSQVTWFWRWLPHRLSKGQSPATVLLRTQVTQMIIFNPGTLGLVSLSYCQMWMDARNKYDWIIAQYSKVPFFVQDNHFCQLSNWYQYGTCLLQTIDHDNSNSLPYSSRIVRGLFYVPLGCVIMNIEGLWEGGYGLASLCEKTRETSCHYKGSTFSSVI